MKFAKSLTSGKGSGESEGTSDEGDSGSDDMDMDMDTYVSDAEEPAPTPTPAKPSPSSVAPRSRTARSPSLAVRPSLSTRGMIPVVPPMPATPTPTSSQRSRTVGRSTYQPSSLPSGNGNNNGSGSRTPATPSVGVTGRRSSFLRHANTKSTTTPAAMAEAEAEAEDADPMPAVLNDSRRNSGTSDATTAPARLGYHKGSGRSCFLGRFRAPSPPGAPADYTANMRVNLAGRQQDEESAAARRHRAQTQGRARLWALNW